MRIYAQNMEYKNGQCAIENIYQAYQYLASFR